MLPCELSYSFSSSTLSAYRDQVLSVEFRSPSASTIRMNAFSPSPGNLRVRFTPTEPGQWTYRTTSSIPPLDGKELTFSVAESGLPGMVAVANLRHWRTGKRQPHLWLAAAAPWLTLDDQLWDRWLEARKQEGFTHVQGVLLSGNQALTSSGEPELNYFTRLDDRVLAAAQRGFVLDLVIADETYRSDFDETVIRYLAARYGGLDVTWQGLQRFDNRPGTREQLRNIGQWLTKYDGYQHPRSSDAQVSSSPLLNDGWLTFLMEGSPYPAVGAVERQFTRQPQIHVISSLDPVAFRKELWSATTSGEYPTVPFHALDNEQNRKALATWRNVLVNTRHWELEPYFDVSGATAVGLEEVEYLAYASTGGVVEITVPKHKYNPEWINPATGEEIPLKDYKGETFSRNTPDNSHDWVLAFPREGKRESMNRYFYFESADPPIQEVETDPARIPFQITEPGAEVYNPHIPVPFQAKITRTTRGNRSLQYLWWGEVIASGEGPRLLGVGSSGNLVLPQFLIKSGADSLTLRVEAINANGKAYEVDRVYALQP